MPAPRLLTARELETVKAQVAIALSAIRQHGNAIESHMATLSDAAALEWAAKCKTP